ncbi:nuclear pore protein 84/107 [Suhomyces tanzawaensis NRRL Y-17324]|uniref:Nuclear pore complex protein n=1 Tax=Suhomyces tanzawaensis NRRL Y-17324 TaxID=984487 RepID=A0A1E4SF51_9ASCO|nr:nuclear pore protein 84/107 [Suhomyces tanzawaensis NRRL Y-17324]ODV78141.1 nuclear pore protein 84/107 [Suhomyces tanzawaensis NRRL Y-17324]
MSSIGVVPSIINIEEQFAIVLQDFLANKQQQNPLEIVSKFKAISASRAIQIGELLAEDETNHKLKEEFENWDLETKLWHLVEILYNFRASSKPELLQEYAFSSLAIKQENWLINHPRVRELTLIIQWLQVNFKSLDSSYMEEDLLGKWTKTRQSINNKDLNVLAKAQNVSDNYIAELDSDAPLRSNKKIYPEDEDIDSRAFHVIYKLLLANKNEEAIEFANNTGNYTLGLILVGYTQEYYDPIIDRQAADADESLLEQSKASGIKHKSLWKKTVYKLSQRSNINRYEKMIYNFLSGGDVSENLKESKDNWEESLLLYLNQLYQYEFEEFLSSTFEETLAYKTPKPQASNVNEVLNILLKSEGSISKESNHPLRIIQGGVIIDGVTSLLHSLITSGGNLQIKPYLVRVVTHLAIFQLLIGESGILQDGTNSINPKDITTIITLYISELSEYQLTELIPIYLTTIPDEKDSRETYSLFLSSITDSKERLRQLEISKKLSNPLVVDDNDLIVVDDSQENKMTNILRRTVERVMKKTEDHYKPQSKIAIQDDVENVDEIDFELYRSVDWFYENEMYEDSITATLIIIRRFLLSGKLATLQKFASSKNFKKLIRDYDIEVHTKSITNEVYNGSISDENKQELLEYEDLVNGLGLISDWKKALANQPLNKKSSFWESKEVQTTIENIIGTLNGLIFNWFNGLIKSSTNDEDVQIYNELRSIYVPYLIIELLQIYKIARFRDWKFLKGAYNIINEIAKEESNDFLKCFLSCGRLNEFLVISGEIFVIASEKGAVGISDLA